MAALIRFKRGTRAQLDAAAGDGLLTDGEPYFITDESRVAVGTGPSTYDAYTKQGEGGGGGSVFDTGWRDITGEMEAGWDGGTLLVRRIGNVVHLGAGMQGGPWRSSGSEGVIWLPPTGFIPSLPMQALASQSTSLPSIAFNIPEYGELYIFAIMADDGQWYPGGTYVTDDPEPDPQDWPGTPWPAP